MSGHRIAVIAGDGIGTEVMPAGIGVVEAAARRFGIELRFTEFDWNCSTYGETGRIVPEDGLDRLAGFDAIYLGAVGMPEVPDHVSLWDMLIPIRRRFNQYVNLRPVKLFEGVRSPLAGRGPDDIDMMIVRENVEGEYSQIGGRLYPGTEHEAAIQQAVFTRRGCDRIMRFAFELAGTRPARKVTSATKSNGIIHSMPYWDERFAAIAAEYPGIETDRYHIDILTAHFVAHPDWFDVVAPTCSATSCPTSAPPSPAPSASPRQATSTRRKSTPRCSSRCTARRPTSPGRASPTPSPRSGRAR